MKKSLIVVDKLTYGYDDAPVISDLSFNINEGEIVLIDGENGVGKTTLLKCITGLINNGKNIYIDKTEVTKNKDLLKKLSFVMSDDFLYDYLTVKENISFFRSMFDENEEFDRDVSFFIEQFNIEKYGDYLVKNLSQGTRNKVYMSIMFSKKHNVLILDEPFTTLDEHTQDTILDFVKGYVDKKEKAVLIVTHIKQFKQIATRIYEMKKGE